jgi:hypothetical protein
MRRVPGWSGHVANRRKPAPLVERRRNLVDGMHHDHLESHAERHLGELAERVGVRADTRWPGHGQAGLRPCIGASTSAIRRPRGRFIPTVASWSRPHCGTATRRPTWSRTRLPGPPIPEPPSAASCSTGWARTSGTPHRAGAMTVLEELEETALLRKRAQPAPLPPQALEDLRGRFGTGW